MTDPWYMVVLFWSIVLSPLFTVFIFLLFKVYLNEVINSYSHLPNPSRLQRLLLYLHWFKLKWRE